MLPTIYLLQLSRLDWNVWNSESSTACLRRLGHSLWNVIIRAICLIFGFIYIYLISSLLSQAASPFATLAKPFKAFVDSYIHQIKDKESIFTYNGNVMINFLLQCYRSMWKYHYTTESYSRISSDMVYKKTVAGVENLRNTLKPKPLDFKTVLLKAGRMCFSSGK